MNKGEYDGMWDDIIDTLSSDNDFIQDTIKESDSIDKLFDKKKKMKLGKVVAQIKNGNKNEKK